MQINVFINLVVFGGNSPVACYSPISEGGRTKWSNEKSSNINRCRKHCGNLTFVAV